MPASQHNLTPAGLILRDRIGASGPVPFREFMETALYHPGVGYYVNTHDPFGSHGDFYTAAQIQPVFSRLMTAVAGELLQECGGDTIIDLGAGRGEMRDAFAKWNYIAVEALDRLPWPVRGLIFANEFFDALPVDVFDVIEGKLQPRLVGWNGSVFHWTHASGIHESTDLPEGFVVERCPSLSMHLGRIASAIEAGYLLVIDYGYTSKERIRVPLGTLMSYRRHRAIDDVLARPGEQDITAHVNFTDLQIAAEHAGFELVRSESLASMLLRAGRPDEFAGALAGDEFKHRQQLKTLLFGMGETFRTMLLRRRRV